MENDKLIELMEDMKKAEQKAVVYQRISAILMLIFVIVFAGAILIMVPSIISTLDTAKETLVHMNDAITMIEDSMDLVTEAIESVDTLATEGENAIIGMEAALQKVNQFDIETLNSAIQDLSDVVEPMSNFFKVFNR